MMFTLGPSWMRSCWWFRKVEVGCDLSWRFAGDGALVVMLCCNSLLGWMAGLVMRFEPGTGLLSHLPWVVGICLMEPCHSLVLILRHSKNHIKKI